VRIHQHGVESALGQMQRCGQARVSAPYHAHVAGEIAAHGREGIDRIGRGGVVRRRILPWLVVRDEGDNVIGRVVKEDAQSLHVCPNLQKPDEIVIVPKSDIEERVKLKSSAMPTGLLVTFTKEEILDLVAYLEGQ